jgi:hypothetical protein
MRRFVYRGLPLIVFAGIVGSLLYGAGAPSWLVYVVRHVIYEVGGHR